MLDNQKYGPRFYYDLDAPTNIDMHDYCVTARELRQVAEDVQTFIDNFENFLLELKAWAQR